MMRSGRPFAKTLGTIAALSVLCAAWGGVARAQDWSMWVDQFGRHMELGQFPDLAPVSPVSRTPTEMAAAFGRICISTRAQFDTVGAAALAEGVTATPQSFPAGRGKVPPASLALWRGNGISVTQSDGARPIDVPQCNATFYVPALPDAQMVTDALSRSFGKTPTNADKAVKSNGKANRFYIPEWSATSPDGSVWIVSVFVTADSSFSPGNRVQIAIRAETRKAK